MQEFFFTLLVIWLFFRIFNKGSLTKSIIINNQNHYHKEEEKKKEGEVKVELVPDKNKKDRSKEGEYIDYEEVK